MTTNHFQGPFLAVPLWAHELIRDSGHSRDMQVLLSLIALMERRTKEVSASVQQIADYSVLSKETVKRSLRWLEESGVVTIGRRKKPSVNVYTINYSPADGVSGDPIRAVDKWVDGVTSDPMMGSAVTLSKPRLAHTACGLRDSSIEVLNIDTNKVKKAASGLEEEMILGGDPEDAEVKVETKVKKKSQRNVNSLVTQFISDPRTIMSHSYSYKEIIILRKTLNTLRDSGLTEFTVSQMIKRFLDVEHWRNSETPVLVFTNKAVQQKLMDQVDTEVVTEDPVLALMMSDFERVGINLPWDYTNDQLLKREVIRHGIDICYRYPEVVAELIKNHNGVPSTNFTATLRALNSLVRVLSGEEDGDLTELHAAVSSVSLPPELHKTSKKDLRPAAGSLLEAVYNYRRSTHGRK